MDRVHKLLDKIKSFDCEPSIFKVYLMASPHLEGFDAWVSFRMGHDGGLDELKVHGNTPTRALEKLLPLLDLWYSKCPNCGNYQHGSPFENGEAK